MPRAILPAIALTFAAGTALAQGLDVDVLRSLDGAKIPGPNGDQVGEIEEILVDDSGTPTAAVVEVGGWLDIGDEDVVISFDNLQYDNGTYTVSMTAEEMETLPKWD